MPNTTKVREVRIDAKLEAEITKMWNEDRNLKRKWPGTKGLEQLIRRCAVISNVVGGVAC